MVEINSASKVMDITLEKSVASDYQTVIDAALRAPYRRELTPNEDGTWFAKIAEFSGCMTEGDTPEEAIANLNDAMREWLRVQLEDHEPIPVPAASLQYSGKFMVRVSSRLHAEIAACAARDGISLNAFAATALARAVAQASSPNVIRTAAFSGISFLHLASQVVETMVAAPSSLGQGGSLTSLPISVSMLQHSSGQQKQ